MSQVSSIVASDSELQEYYAGLKAQHVKPAWIGVHQTDRPTTTVVPFVWHWRDIRPQLMRAAELVGTEQAERRVLRMTNPGLEESASNTLVANYQIVMPGEIARAHRHTAAALRFIVEGKGGSTVVNGTRIPMYPGDLVLTPNWTWHDHINDTAEPMIWLDGLDTPLVRMLEAGFYEPFDRDRQQVGPDNSQSLMHTGYGGLRPSLEPAVSPRYSPRWHYPLAQAAAELERLAEQGSSSSCDGVMLEYTNPLTGGSVMPTIACAIQRLGPGEHTRAHRHVCCTNYHVIEGSGYSLVGGERLDWEDKDVFTVPTWATHEHVNTGERPAYLFSFTDAPAMKALDLYREEAVELA
ncbi:MAG: cupin domain-containing protein [Chloroflexota bacterium]